VYPSVVGLDALHMTVLKNKKENINIPINTSRKMALW